MKIPVHRAKSWGRSAAPAWGTDGSQPRTPSRARGYLRRWQRARRQQGRGNSWSRAASDQPPPDARPAVIEPQRRRSPRWGLLHGDHWWGFRAWYLRKPIGDKNEACQARLQIPACMGGASGSRGPGRPRLRFRNELGSRTSGTRGREREWKVKVT
jgi:hypothetical protein